MTSLKDKVAVITGGATGIGFAAARRFLAEGAKVVIAGRRQASLDRAVAELGGNVLAVDADVTSLPDLKRLMTVVQERHGRIDVLVANAGIGRFGPMESVTPEVFDELTDVHFRGAFFTVQQAVPMTRAYNAAKAAVRLLGPKSPALADSAELASVMLFLAADESSSFTGAELVPDGGIAQV